MRTGNGRLAATGRVSLGPSFSGSGFATSSTTADNARQCGDSRPIAFLLTGGQVADCTAGDRLLEQMPESPILHADKVY
jgi:hypothetical protein